MITVLGALGFGGGVWYSRINDEFHDLFTQYVPYGEQAVLYLEERDFRQRFPAAALRKTSTPRDGETQVKIPAQSGASWRVADDDDRHSSALPKAAFAAKDAVTPKTDPPLVVREARMETAKLAETEARETTTKEKDVRSTKVAAPASDKSSDPKTKTAPSLDPAVPAAKKASAGNASEDVSEQSVSGQKGYRPPEVNEPSSWPPASPIDPLSVNEASEPIVQELVHMLNDIIFVINADGAEEKYGRTISKAKDELNEVGRHIREMKEYAEQQAADQVRAKVDDFDRAATHLVARVEAAMAAQEAAWRREFGAEMDRLHAAYDAKVRTVAERERQVGEARADSQLLAQALELQRQFARDVKAQVEEERGARLGRLEALHRSVADLEALATDVNRVVDASLQTQRLHVAIDAVKAGLADPAQPRPFIRELVALKETAGDDAAVVAAAIASIDPKAYQRGVASHAELVDRFRRVAGEVRKASLLPEDAGVASLASSWALSKLLFQKKGLAAGDDVESILTRTHTFLEQGDLDRAAREMNGLAGWAKVLSKDWLAEIRKVLEVKQALEVSARDPLPIPSSVR